MAIIKYKETFIGMTNVTYEEVTIPYKIGRKFSKDEAKKRIREKGMIKVFSCEDGVVWDTPDEPFFREYNRKGIKIEDI